MKIHFTKMHGIGNDYIYINCLEGIPFDPHALSKAMSPRHFSVGADGVVLICASDVADAKMRMFNLDGSEGKMCGNAIRCVGKYLYEKAIVTKETMTIETLSGIKTLQLHVKNGVVETVSVNMGFASFEPQDIPVLKAQPMINETVTVKTADGNVTVPMTAVSMGNPHAVCYVNNPETLELSKIGPVFENLGIFPERVNTEFVRVADKNTLNMRVWERGSGETYACGTGACAVAAASVKNGICDKDQDITVHLIGGDLTVRVSENYEITMTGKAAFVYEGVYNYED